MYESMRGELNDKLNMAQVNANESARTGQQIGTELSNLGKVIDQGMSAYAQSTVNKDKYELNQRLIAGQEKFLDVNNENASTDYAKWAESQFDEHFSGKGSLVKGYINEYRQGIIDSARTSFDKQLVTRIDSANKLTAIENWNNGIKAFSDDPTSIDTLDDNYVWTTEFGADGLKVVHRKVDVGDMYDINEECLTEQHVNFRKLLNYLYHTQCPTMDTDSAKAYVESKKYDIELGIIQNDIIRDSHDWAENGRNDGDNTQHFTPEQLKNELKSYYKSDNKRPFLDGTFDETESANIDKFIDEQVDDAFNKIRAASDDVIYRQMSDYWREQDSSAIINPTDPYSKLQQAGLITLNEKGEVIDHSKIKDSTWKAIHDKVEFNKHLHNADLWSKNKIDMTGDGVVDLEDMAMIDPEAVDFLRKKSNGTGYYVAEGFEYKQFTSDLTKIADSTLQEIIDREKPVIEGEETPDYTNVGYFASIYGYKTNDDGSLANDEEGNPIRTGIGAYDLARMNMYYDMGDYKLIDELAKQRAKDITGSEWDELTDSQKSSLRSQVYKENKSDIDTIMSDAYKYEDKNGKFASSKSEGITKLDSMLEYERDQYMQYWDAKLREFESMAEADIMRLDSIALDPRVDYNLGGSFVDDSILDLTMQKMQSMCSQYGVKVNLPTREQINAFKATCDANGRDFNSATKVQMIRLYANALAAEGITNGLDSNEFLRYTLGKDIIPVVKQDVKSRYETNVATAPSGNGKFEKANSFSDIDKSVSDLINTEVMTYNGYDYLKPKKSAEGEMQSILDKVISGEWDIGTAQSFALSDMFLSADDTKALQTDYTGLLELITNNKNMDTAVSGIFSDYRGLVSESVIFRYLASSLGDLGKNPTDEQVQSTLQKIQSDLAVDTGRNLKKGLVEYTSKTSTTVKKYEFGGKKWSSDLTASIDEASQRAKDRPDGEYSIVPALVNTYMNSDRIGTAGYMTIFDNINKETDVNRKTNRLMMSALECMGVSTKGLSLDSKTFSDDFESHLMNLGFNEGEVSLVIDICGELKNKAEEFTTASASTIGVPKTVPIDGRPYPTSNGFYMADGNRSFLDKDGKNPIDSSFMGTEHNGMYDYKPLKDDISEGFAKKAESDDVYKQLQTLSSRGFGLSEDEYEFQTIRYEYDTQKYTYDGYTGKNVRAKLDEFFANHPNSPYAKLYGDDVDLEEFFMSTTNEQHLNMDDMGVDILKSKALELFMDTDEYKAYMDNKAKLESPDYNPSKGWILPVPKPIFDDHGNLVEVVMVDQDTGETVSADSNDYTRQWLKTTEAETIAVRLPSEDGYNEYHIQTSELRRIARSKGYLKINGKNYNLKSLEKYIVRPNN